MKKKILLFTAKRYMQLIILALYSTILISCDNDKDLDIENMEEDPCASLLSKNDETCGIRLFNLEPIPRTGDVRMYEAKNILNEPGLIWGISEAITSEKCFSFIEEENLINYGVRIISTSNTESMFSVEYLNTYTEDVFVAVQHIAGDDVICISGVQEVFEE